MKLNTAVWLFTARERNEWEGNLFPFLILRSLFSLHLGYFSGRVIGLKGCARSSLLVLLLESPYKTSCWSSNAAKIPPRLKNGRRNRCQFKSHKVNYQITSLIGMWLWWLIRRWLLIESEFWSEQSLIVDTRVLTTLSMTEVDFNLQNNFNLIGRYL